MCLGESPQVLAILFALASLLCSSLQSSVNYGGELLLICSEIKRSLVARFFSGFHRGKAGKIQTMYFRGAELTKPVANQDESL